MRRVRVIPVLTSDGSKLVKTVKFKKPNYIGDPINAIKIFNDKEVDEIVVLDISASKQGKAPNYKLIEEMAGECFMPLGYGGGISDYETAKRIFDSGVEKVILNTALNDNLELVSELASNYGNQSIVACIDVKKTFFSKQAVYYKSADIKDKMNIELVAIKLAQSGVGEIILNNIDNEGTFLGYDLKLLNLVARSVSIPVVVCGGASSVADFLPAVKSGASALAASSMFVYKANNIESILINYPSQEELIEKLYSKI